MGTCWTGRRALWRAGPLTALVASSLTVGAGGASASPLTQESPGVRSELAHIAPPREPIVSTQGNTGGRGALPAIKGTVVPRYSTPSATTYALSGGLMETEVRAAPAEPGAEAEPAGSALAGASPLVAGFSPSCTLSNTAPTTSSCNEATMLSGYNATTKTTDRSLIQFTMPTLPEDVEVRTAQLALYVGGSTTTTPAAMGAYRVTSEWNAKATWNTTNGKTAWTTPGGDYSTGADGVVNPEVGASTGWAYWYPLQMVQEWYTGPAIPGEGASNFGMLLKDVSEGSTNNDLTFETPSSGERYPRIVIGWRDRGVGHESQFTNLPIPLTDRMSLNVNAASGDLAIENHALHVAGRGLDFQVDNTWNSTLPAELKGWLGYGWEDSNRPWVETREDGSVGFSDGEDGDYVFQKNGTSYVTPPGLQAFLCGTESKEGPCENENTKPPPGASFRLTFEQSQVHYDFGANSLLDIQDKSGNTISYPEINGKTGQEKIVDTEGRGYNYQWNHDSEGFPFVESVHDEVGERWLSYGYETSGEGHHHLTSYKDPAGGVTKYGYTGDRVTRITSPRGDVTLLGYDSEGRVTEITRTTNSEHTTGPTATFKYYPLGKGPSPCSSMQKATVITDPEGNKTTYCANHLDEVEQTKDAKGNVSQATYSPFGRIASTTAEAPGAGESGDVSTFDYDESGQNLMCVITGTSSAGSSSCPSIPSSSSLVTAFNYTDKNNPFAVTQDENTEANSVYSCYNGGKQEGSIGPECPKTATGPAGSLENETDQLASENELKFSYNTSGMHAGTIASSTDADGNVTSYEYDSYGNLSKIIPPSGSGIAATTITVDADSRPHTITDGAGHVATIHYDAMDRITEVVYSGTGTGRTVKYEYDKDGNLIKREDPTGTTKYTVDPLNRITEEALPGSLSNSYTYDNDSNMTSFSDSGGTTKYAYNSLNELESMTEPGETKKTKFAYDDDHRLTKITYPSGISENYGLEETTGRPESITTKGVKGLPVPSLSYTYRSGGNDTGLIQSVSDGLGDMTEYTYDGLERLKGAVTTGSAASLYSFKFDGDGNRTSQTVNPSGSTGGSTTYYALNAGNELECRQTVAPPCSKSLVSELSAYSYDGAGGETAITPKGDTSGTSFSYNAADELSSLTPSGGSALALSYGGAGQDDLVTIGSSIKLQNSLLGLTREVNSSGTSYFARTPTGLLIDQRTPAGNFNPLYDAQGDVIALLKGKVAERTFRYGPYGENVKSEGEQSIPYPFGFKGGYRMPGGNIGEGNVANGLYHFGQRYYDPTVGRWTQLDPRDRIAAPKQANRYLFAGADPVNDSDPSGLEILEEAEEGAEEVGEFFGEGAEGAAITTADLGFKAFGAFDAASVCVDTAGVGCLAAGEAYLLADKIASDTVFKNSYLEK
jgi:RHS repeat-associated protein